MTARTLASTQFQVEFRVRMELGDPDDIPLPGIWGTGLWGTNVWGASGDAYMVDVSDYVLAVSIRTGRQRYTGRFRTGICVVDLDNEGGEWTPGAGVPLPGFLPLRPGRRLEIFALYGSAAYMIYRGFVNDIGDAYTVGSPYTTRVTGIDLMGLAAVNDTVALSSPVGSGESSSSRIHRILDHHFDRPPPVDVRGVSNDSLSGTSMLSTVMAQDALQELQVTADSEGGGIWIEPNGQVSFALSEFFSDAAAGDPDWLVGFTGGVGVVHQDRTEWALQDIINEAHMARRDGEQQDAANSGSIGVFGRRTHRRLDLETDDDSHVAYLAQRIVTDLAASRPRVQGITLQPSTGAEIDVGLLAEIGDVLLLNVSAALSGWSYVLKTQVFGVDHDVTPGRWRVSFLVNDTQVTPGGAFSSGFTSGFDVD